jgi:hypothetical protein
VSKVKKLWRGAPSLEDLKAAQNYLALIYSDVDSIRLSLKLSRTRTSSAAAKDLLRASNLPLLPRDESHVAADLKRIRKGKSLSPVLLVRGDMSRGFPLVIADGYHRICAICYYDEDAPIACRIATLRR